MFKPSQLHHRSCGLQCEAALPNTFGVVCWNVYKQNKKHVHFKSFLHHLSTKHDISLYLFQEAAFNDNEAFALEHFAFDGAANLEIKGLFYGVMTASSVEAFKAQAHLSEGRESLIGSHKSLLVSYYPLSNGSTLLVLNVHAINFRENLRYIRELEHFLLKVNEHKGPMIVAGDFNTWNSTRMNKLHLLCKKLGLEMVPFKESDKIKSFRGLHLDFVFYRGLQLMEFEVVDEKMISDHNPLLATFRVLDQ